MSKVKYTGLEPHIPLRHHVDSVRSKMDLIIPGLNHSIKELREDNSRSAQDLTGSQIVDGAADWQRDWMRKQGLIA